MNIGILGYRILELFVALYLAYMFLKMGRNTDVKYKFYREKIAKMLPLYKKDVAFYITSILFLALILLRAIEGAYHNLRP